MDPVVTGCGDCRIEGMQEFSEWEISDHLDVESLRYQRLSIVVYRILRHNYLQSFPADESRERGMHLLIDIRFTCP
jgi:hypothetical protein